MAIIPILIEVEDTALGPVMILLKKTIGVIGFDVKLDAFLPSAQLPQGTSIQDIVLAELSGAHPEARRASDITAKHGLNKTSVYGALNVLKERGAVMRSPDVARGWQLSPKAATEMGKTLMLTHHKTNGAAPVGAKPKRTSRADAWAGVHGALSGGVCQRSAIIKYMTEIGAGTPNSIGGILERARRDKLIKSDGQGRYELTAKGLAKTPEPSTTMHHTGGM